jgi:seryl-tRNA synthetase
MAELESTLAETQQQLEAAQSSRNVMQEALEQVGAGQCAEHALSAPTLKNLKAKLAKALADLVSQSAAGGNAQQLQLALMKCC